jgi:ABC-type transport system involved in multi-copper enzyme maturation permease subunit
MPESRRGEWTGILRFDYRHMYRSPLIEILIAVSLYVSYGAALGAHSYLLSVIADPTHVEIFRSYTHYIATLMFWTSLERNWMLILFLLPLLVAFTTARSFEDGFFRTLLSYPVRRWQLLIMRTLIPVVVIGTISTLCSLLFVILVVPTPLNLAAILWLVGFFWLGLLMVGTSVVFLAVLFKRMILAAIGGVSIWYLILIISYDSGVPEILRWIASPVNLLGRYIGGDEIISQYIGLGSNVPVLMDVLQTAAVMGAISILLLVMSLLLFRRMEV